MAIAEMSRLSVVALLSDKDKIYDALQKTGAAQIKSQTEKEYAVPLAAADDAELKAKIDRAKKCLDFISDEIELLPKDERGAGVIKDGFPVTTTEFFAVGEKTDEIEGVLSKIEELSDKKNALKARQAKVNEKIRNYEPYALLKNKFSEFSDTPSVKVYLGIVPADKTEKCLKEIKDCELSEAFIECDGKNGEVVSVAAYKPNAEAVEKVLSSCGFIKCPFKEDVTAAEKISEAENELKEIENEFSGKGYGDFKLAVGEAVAAELAPVRESYEKYISDKAELERIFRDGAARAEKDARKVYFKAMKKVGFVL